MQANQQCLLHMNWPPACPILFGLLCLMMNFVLSPIKTDCTTQKFLPMQIKRMLSDQKSNRFAEEFSKQWLDLGGVDRVAVNPRYHQNFDNRLKPYMQAESLEFFKEIFRNDLPITKIIDADFTMLNARLAKHYGLEGPKSQHFVRTSLKGTNRTGGILGHASIHLSGSDGAESHPIRRAVWVRERLTRSTQAPATRCAWNRRKCGRL